MCTKPLKAIVLGVNPINGKNIIKVVPETYKFKDDDKIIPIPCGKCIECRLNYSRQWADRMIAEASYYDSNCFLTLTYDDDHLPDPLTRLKDDVLEISTVHPLVKRDLQLFMKRLRKKYTDTKIRFYACGEYGDQSMRPHYHIILFNFQPPDAKLLFRKENINYYISDDISKLWDKGLHILTDVSWNTCAYVARYVTKKLKNGYDEMPDLLNYTREFSLMSRKPGIGYQYFQDNVSDFIDFGSSFISTENGSKRLMTNKYYVHLFDIDYPEFDILRKEKVKKDAFNDMKNAIELNHKSYDDIVSDREANLQAKTINFNRKEI